MFLAENRQMKAVVPLQHYTTAHCCTPEPAQPLVSESLNFQQIVTHFFLLLSWIDATWPNWYCLTYYCHLIYNPVALGRSVHLAAISGPPNIWHDNMTWQNKTWKTQFEEHTTKCGTRPSFERIERMRAGAWAGGQQPLVGRHTSILSTIFTRGLSVCWRRPSFQLHTCLPTALIDLLICLTSQKQSGGYCQNFQIKGWL